MEKGMRTLANSLTLIGSVVLIGCVGYLMGGWWREERWGWVVIGVVVIVANLGVVAVRLRPTPKPRDWSIDEVRAIIEPVHGEVAQIRTLRRADKGLSLAQAAMLVSEARGQDEG
jgi:membrane protein YdbS with pleckstrin-like domain